MTGNVQSGGQTENDALMMVLDEGDNTSSVDDECVNEISKQSI